MAPSVKALRRWLVFVALLRLLSVYISVFSPATWKDYYDLRPDLVNELFSRTFAVWTLTSCMLCLICARNPCNPAIYGATLASFALALGYFVLELFVFKTLSLKRAAMAMSPAGISLLWMGAGWNYYTRLPFIPESSAASEDVELDSAAAVKRD